MLTINSGHFLTVEGKLEQTKGVQLGIQPIVQSPNPITIHQYIK